eukprot:161597-Chlamydomonas_euryale.AAC.2
MSYTRTSTRPHLMENPGAEVPRRPHDARQVRRRERVGGGAWGARGSQRRVACRVVVRAREG